MMKHLLVFALAPCVALLASVAELPVSAQDVRPAAANSCLSIPACAFLEQHNTYVYYRHLNLTFSSGSGNYYAPVYLPHGSVIRKIRLICKDEGDKNILVVLDRLDSAQDRVTLSSFSSSGTGSGWKTFNTTAVSPRYVHNFKYSYLLRVNLPGTYAQGYYLGQVKIFYDAP